VKNFILACGAAFTALFSCPTIVGAAGGGQILVDADLPIPAPAAYSSTFSIRADGIDWASAQLVATSATIATGNFTDGRTSTGTFTVVSYVALSTAAATMKLTVSSSTALANDCVSGGGPNSGSFNVCNPKDWAVDTTSQTACNIAKAINSYNVIAATCGLNGNSIIYTTAPVGSIYNQFSIATSSYSALQVTTVVSSTIYQVGYSTMNGSAIGLMTGGQDNQTVSVNGKTFIANVDFYPVTSVAQTATNLAAAINASSMTLGVVSSAGGAVVYTTATVVGTAPNSYIITSSSYAAVTLSTLVSSVTAGPATGTLAGGKESNYALSTSTITIASNGFVTGLAVLYTTSTGVGITPLAWGTTYYAITNPTMGTNAIGLATSSSNSISGLAIVLSSTRTSTTQGFYSLAPLALTGTPTFSFYASNDNLNWLPYTTTPFNITLPVVSFGVFYASGTVVNYDFGHYNYSYLGGRYVAPTTGAVNLRVHVISNAP
jgi:hypothetical protein